MLLELSLRPLIASFLVLLLAGCDRQKAEAPQGEAVSGNAASETADAAPTGRLDRSHAGTAAPATPFNDPDGNPVTLADFEGTPLLVNLWATWCAPCIAEMPTLDALAAREGKALKVLTISQDVDGQEKVDAFFAQGGFKHLEAYRDSELAMMSALKVDTLPTTILYDAEGKEVWRMTAKEDWRGARAAKLLREASKS